MICMHIRKYFRKYFGGRFFYGMLVRPLGCRIPVSYIIYLNVVEYGAMNIIRVGGRNIFATVNSEK